MIRICAWCGKELERNSVHGPNGPDDQTHRLCEVCTFCMDRSKRNPPCMKGLVCKQKEKYSLKAEK